MNVKLRLFLKFFYKLRYTGIILAKQAGTSLKAIPDTLTHSDILTTKTYVNTSNIIKMVVGEIASRNLKNQWYEFYPKNT